MLKLTNDDLQKLQKLELSLLKKFAFFCDDNNISFQATFGTLLGAIRHNDFIPWDDDVDVAMQYDDYKKLLLLATPNGILFDDVYLQNSNTDNYYLLSWSKIRVPSINLREERTDNRSMGGIFLDVFPIINFPENKRQQRKMLNKIRFYISVASVHTPKSNLFKKIIIKIASFFLKPRFCLQKIDKILDKTHASNVGSKYSYLLSHNVVIKTEWIDSTIKEHFSDFLINVPRGFDELLKTMYGDYKIIPPENKRENNHTYLELDLSKDL